jgi:chaperonin GroES
LGIGPESPSLEEHFALFSLYLPAQLCAGNIYVTTPEAYMNIRPLYDRIVVKRIEEKETTSNGIIIPDSAKEKPQEGEVIAVGHGKRLEDGTLVPLDVKAGDRILFGKYSGNDTKLDGTEYIIMREDDVLGVLSAK